MTQRFDSRLRRLEASNPIRKKPCFWYVLQVDLERWKEVLTSVTDSDDWSTYYDDLALKAPSVYDAYRKAGWCK